MIKNFYDKLFKQEPSNETVVAAPNGFPILSENQILLLLKEFDIDEVKRVVFDMTPFKAPGEDGLHAGFYKHTWPVVRESIHKYVSDFLTYCTLPESSTDTIRILVLNQMWYALRRNVKIVNSLERPKTR